MKMFLLFVKFQILYELNKNVNLTHILIKTFKKKIQISFIINKKHL